MQTNNAILNAEAQLVAEVRPSDEYSGDRRTSDSVELDPRLVLQTLRQDTYRRHCIGKRRLGPKKKNNKKLATPL